MHLLDLFSTDKNLPARLGTRSSKTACSAYKVQGNVRITGGVYGEEQRLQRLSPALKFLRGQEVGFLQVFRVSFPPLSF